LRTVAAESRRLAEHLEQRLDAETDASLAVILDTVSRMRTLLDDLLAYSRAHQQGSVFVATDTIGVFEAAVANLERPIAESGASVTRGPLPIVTGDPTQLLQVFQNLIANALKYRSEAPPRVQVTAQRLQGE